MRMASLTCGIAALLVFLQLGCRQDLIAQERAIVDPSPELTAILQRLDRLEEENRTLQQRNERLERLVGTHVLGTNGALESWPNMETGSEASSYQFVPGQRTSEDRSGTSLASHAPMVGDHFIHVSPDQEGTDPSTSQLDSMSVQFQDELARLGRSIDSLNENLTISTRNKAAQFKLAIFGNLNGEMLFSEKRPVIPSAVTFLSPDFGAETQTIDFFAKSSNLGLLLTGPKVGSFDLGGLLLTNFYGDNILADSPGVFVIVGFTELRNEYWRFLAGLSGDVVLPLAPTTLNFPRCAGVGNMGFQRAQFRVERYFYPHDWSQWTVQFGLGDPIATSYVDFDLVEGFQESNGWPNIEGRAAWGLGPHSESRGRPNRTVEVGFSGVIGELRRTGTGVPDTEDVWAGGIDAQLQLSEQFGVKGELFTGKTIGMYNAAIIQNFNGKREGIHSTGGWGEVYAYWTPSLHSHFGYAIDNPRDGDLTDGLPSRNEVVFANILWEATKSIEVGFEISHWKTAYMPPFDGNDSMIYHTRVRMKF